MEGAQEPEPIGAQEAIDRIEMIMQGLNVVGGNDYELPELQRLIVKIHDGQISPTEALQQARGIESRKSSDYH